MRGTTANPRACAARSRRSPATSHEEADAGDGSARHGRFHGMFMFARLAVGSPRTARNAAVNWVTAPDGFDEIFEGGAPRSHYAPLVGILESFTREDVERRERLQRLALMNHGITFTVSGAEEGLERIFPFDFV